jgi:hypothetical protein
MSVTWHRTIEGKHHYAFEEQRVLYRSDTHAPLSVVSQRFQEVQPMEIYISIVT